MKKFIAYALLLATSVLGAAENNKPNILFIFADDMCYDGLQAMGNEEVKTPNLDRLAERGMTFSHAYNMGGWSGAICVASRQMLNSGRFLWNARDRDYAAENRMWSQQMQEAGYRTYMAGKWHVNTADAEKIFDRTGSVRPGMPNQTKEGYNRPLNENDKEWLPWDRDRGGFWEGGEHWSKVLREETVGFLVEAADDDIPFFIYAAFNAPHDPRQSPKKYVEMYPLENISVPENFQPKYEYAEQIGAGEDLRDERLAPFPRTEYAVKVNRQEYYAIITHMDHQIGKILDALEKSGKADNTYIFFTADHGLAVGDHGLMGKQNMYDHSIRAPFLVVGPGIEGGTVNNTPIYLQDVMPTTLELAGLSRQEYVQFRSILPQMQGRSTSHYDSIYSAYRDLQRAITKGGFKLIHYTAPDVYRLFDLQKDPWEMNDLAGKPEYASKLDELKAALADLQAAMNDPLLTQSN